MAGVQLMLKRKAGSAAFYFFSPRLSLLITYNHLLIIGMIFLIIQSLMFQQTFIQQIFIK